jgi:hypothetical protein
MRNEPDVDRIILKTARLNRTILNLKSISANQSRYTYKKRLFNVKSSKNILVLLELLL